MVCRLSFTHHSLEAHNHSQIKGEPLGSLEACCFVLLLLTGLLFCSQPDRTIVRIAVPFGT